jgi:replication-associated recombination protein RarA
MKRVDPSAFKPRVPDDLIGHARAAATALVAKAIRYRRDGSGPLKVLLYGPPGTGKTTIAEMVAAELTAGERLAVDDANGKEITVDTVRGWLDRLSYGSLFGGGWQVRIVNELDRCSRDAQDLMLTYLDRMGEGKALIGTSNLKLDLLSERFQTRFQAWKIAGPESDEIAAWLVRRWKAPKALARQIAVGCGGCVRAALADLESAMDIEAVR